MARSLCGVCCCWRVAEAWRLCVCLFTHREIDRTGCGSAPCTSMARNSGDGMAQMVAMEAPSHKVRAPL
jgi:hypothetical protein